MSRYAALYDAILVGDAKGSEASVRQAVAEGVDPRSLLDDSMIPAMSEVGRRFEEHEYFVPEMLIAARAMKAGLAVLKPLMTGDQETSMGRVLIGTVTGDLHDIGKNLVSAMLEGAGFEIIDLGVNVPPRKFIDAIRERQPQIVALSALLTTTMVGIKTTIDAIKEAGLRDQVKIMIGGAPTTQQFADEIGADGYSPNANGAVGVAKHFLAAV